jgi:hypothetical protein
MAHGLSAMKEMSLDKFAEGFAAAGLGAPVEPRQETLNLKKGPNMQDATQKLCTRRWDPSAQG